MRFAAVSAVLLFAWANHAAADLYRWVDPETGSVKFSSYPPPWFGDAAAQQRAPKVEHIPAGTPATATESLPPEVREPSRPLPEAGGKLQAPISSSTEERRKGLLKQIAAQVAALAVAKPEEGARINADMADRVREYNSAETFLAQVDPGGEAARRADWNEVVAALDGHRRRMLEQLAAIRAPEQGASPDSVRGVLNDLGRQLAALSSVDGALKLVDPRGAPVRDAEQKVLAEKIAPQLKALQDASVPRPAQ